jgi:hypothetical protein
MTDAAAFQATVHGFRTVPTRGVVSITIEAPIEQHARIAEIAEHGAWVAVARLEQPKGGDANTERPKLSPRLDNAQPSPSRDSNSTAAGAKLKVYTLPQRVAMVCNEPAFWRFLQEINGWGGHDLVTEQKAIELVREYCGVSSRSQILPGTEAAKRWDELHARYLLWSQS